MLYPPPPTQKNQDLDQEMREMREEVKVNWSRGKGELSKERCNLFVEPEQSPVFKSAFVDQSSEKSWPLY